jgi:hypothetical protein
MIILFSRLVYTKIKYKKLNLLLYRTNVWCIIKEQMFGKEIFLYSIDYFRII